MKMFKKIIAACVGSIMVAAVAAPSTAMAQKVAYYDHGKVVRDSKAWKSLEAQLQTKRSEITAQLQPVATEVGKEGAEIEKLVKGMKPEDAQKKHGKKIGEWQQKRASLQAAQNRVNQELSIVAELAEVKINTVMSGIFDDVAKQAKVDVLVPKSGLGYYSAKYDVTDKVLSKVNGELSTMSIDGLLEEVQKQQQAAAAKK